MDELDLPGPTRASVFEEDEDERYLVRSSTEICSILSTVSARHALARVSFNHGEDFILTTLLMIDPKAGYIVFEEGPDELRNQRLTEAESLVFVTQLDKIKIQFRMDSVEEVEFQGAPAFLSPIPSSLLRLQRREFFRVATLTSQPMNARLLLDGPKGPQPTTMRGIDVSLGGVALLASETIEGVAAGDTLRNVELNLPGIGQVNVDLAVQSVRPQHSGGKLCTRFGCRYINLAPAMASRVQRYINKLELGRAHRI